MDKLWLLMMTQKEFCKFSINCFIETWPREHKLNSSASPPWFQMIQIYTDTKNGGKSKGESIAAFVTHMVQFWTCHCKGEILCLSHWTVSWEFVFILSTKKIHLSSSSSVYLTLTERNWTNWLSWLKCDKGCSGAPRADCAKTKYCN